MNETNRSSGDGPRRPPIGRLKGWVKTWMGPTRGIGKWVIVAARRLEDASRP